VEDNSASAAPASAVRRILAADHDSMQEGKQQHASIKLTALLRLDKDSVAADTNA
jgi:hypothetical protein